MQTRAHEKHLRSEKMSEILQAMGEVTFTTVPVAAERPHCTMWSGNGFRAYPVQQQGGLGSDWYRYSRESKM